MLLQCCPSNMSKFWTWQDLLWDLRLLWHYSVAWMSWTSFPEVLEMTLNNGNNRHLTDLVVFFFSDIGPNFSFASFTRHTSFRASRIVIRAPCHLEDIWFLCFNTWANVQCEPMLLFPLGKFYPLKCFHFRISKQFSLYNLLENEQDNVKFRPRFILEVP